MDDELTYDELIHIAGALAQHARHLEDVAKLHGPNRNWFLAEAEKTRIVRQRVIDVTARQAVFP